MKRIRNLFFTIVVSPEVVVVLLVAVVLEYSPGFMDALGERLKSDSEVWKYMPTLPLVFAGTAFGLSSKIRAPLENSTNKRLYEWPLYQLLVDRVFVSMTFAGICGAIGVLAWFFSRALPTKIVSSMFLAATGISAATAFTMLLAHQKLRELIDRYSN